MNDFVLTEEQEAIREAFMTGENMAITAGAGAAKTTTCRVISNDTKDRGSYIAYNSSIAGEAKATFPRNVICKTSHGFAFVSYAVPYKHKLNGPYMPAKNIAQVLDIKSPFKLPTNVIIAPWALARAAMDTVKFFCYSADDAIKSFHVPKINNTEEVWGELSQLIAGYAEKAWQDLTNKDGRISWGRSHDYYLKMAQIGGLTLPGEFFMLDEGQDTNPCVIHIFESQEGQKIVVGDKNQQLYGWRGAIDYMSQMKAEHHLTLSKSFRFGDAIAIEANKCLELLEAELRISGFDQINSEVVELTEPDAVLCRTNAEVVAQAMHFQREAEKTIAVVGGTDDIKRFAQAAIDLQSGRNTSHPELIAFKNWGEVKEFVAEEGGDLKVFVNLIDTYGSQAVMLVAETAVDEKYADITLSTSHKAKGREWNRVKIGNDFKAPEPDSETGEEGELSRSELMLAYVSVTRAKLQLDRGSLDWVDKYLPNNNHTNDTDNPPLSQHPEVEKSE